jgi:hypothetical protein
LALVKKKVLLKVSIFTGVFWRIDYQQKIIFLGGAFWTLTPNFVVSGVVASNHYQIFFFHFGARIRCGVEWGVGLELSVHFITTFELTCFNLAVYMSVSWRLKIASKLFGWRQFGQFGKLEIIVFLIRKFLKQISWFIVLNFLFGGGLKRNARILIVILKYDTPINLFWGYLMCSLLAL